VSKNEPTRQEVHALVSRVLSWPDLAKFEVFEALLNDLGDSVELDDPVVRLAGERREALDMIARASEFLGLPAGKAPTVKQFNQAVKDVASDWNSQRVIRVWEQWRLAIQAFKGEREVQTRARREARSQIARGGGRRSRVDYLNGVRKWLQSRPGVETAKSYSAYAEQFNVKLAEQNAAGAPVDEKQRPLVSADAVRENLSLPDWPTVIRVAKRQSSLQAAQEQAFAERIPPPRQNRIIGLAAFARLLKRTDGAVRELAETDKNFPTPIAFIQGHRAWLYEDARLYKRGLAPPSRDEGELQALFADTEELRAKVRLMPVAFNSALARQRWGKIPRPDGALVAGVYYWERAQIENWRKARSKRKKKPGKEKGKAELTPEQEERELAKARQAAAIAASLKAAQQPGRRRKGKRKTK